MEPHLRAHLPTLLNAVGSATVLEAVGAAFGTREFVMTQINLYFDPPEESRNGLWHRDGVALDLSDGEKSTLLQQHASPTREIHLHLPMLPTRHTHVVPGSHSRLRVQQDGAMAALRAANESGTMEGEVALDMNAGDAAVFSVKAIHRGSYTTGVPRRTIAVSFCASSVVELPTASTLVERKGYDHRYQPWFVNEPHYLDGCNPESAEFWKRCIEVYLDAWTEDLANGLNKELRRYFWPRTARPALSRL